MYLDNSIIDDCTSTSIGVDEYMGYKINRKVYINNQLKWVHANSEQDYADKIILLAMASSNATVPATEKPKHRFSDYALNWFEIYSRPNIETVTAITYERQINKYLIPMLGDLYVEEIKTDHLQTLFNSMGGAKTTKDKLKIVLNQILNAAVEDGFLDKNPLKSSRLKINGEASRETKPYSVEQMRFIAQHIPDIRKPSDKIFMALLALHPLRLEEALGLRFEDFDLERREFTVNRAVTHPDRNKPEIKDTKTEASHRTLELSSLAYDLISQIENKSGFVVGGDHPFSYTQVRKACERVKQDIGFSENITPIRFRTTVLTDIYDQTKDVPLTKQSGGHATSATTFKYYVKGRGNCSSSTRAIDNLYLA